MKTKSALKAYWPILLLLSAVCALVSGGGQAQNTVTIINDGELPTRDIKVFAAGDEIWSGALVFTDSKKLRFQPAQDGSFEVHLSFANGKIHKVQNLGYTTRLDGQKHELHIEGGSVRYTANGGVLPPLQNRVQTIIDIPELSLYLHTDIPENQPLTVSAPEEMKVEALGAKVGWNYTEVVEQGRLRITALDEERYHLEIPSEGVSGELELEQRAEKWAVKSVRVWEN